MWQPTLVFLPGEPHGQRSLVGYSPRGDGVGHDRLNSPARALQWETLNLDGLDETGSGTRGQQCQEEKWVGSALGKVPCSLCSFCSVARGRPRSG